MGVLVKIILKLEWCYWISVCSCYCSSREAPIVEWVWSLIWQNYIVLCRRAALLCGGKPYVPVIGLAPALERAYQLGYLPTSFACTKILHVHDLLECDLVLTRNPTATVGYSVPYGRSSI